MLVERWAYWVTSLLTGRLEKSICNLKLIACWDVAIMSGNPVPASTEDQCGIPI